MRKAIPKKLKAEVWLRDEGKCVSCGNKEGLHIEHHLPVWLGGKNEIDNLRLMCLLCHAPKTKTEAKNRAKIKRIQTHKQRQAKRKAKYKWPKQKIKSRGFQKRDPGRSIKDRS